MAHMYNGPPTLRFSFLTEYFILSLLARDYHTRIGASLFYFFFFFIYFSDAHRFSRIVDIAIMDSCFQTFKADVWSMIIFVIVTAPIFLTLMKTRGRIVMRILADNYIYVWGIYCQQGLSGNCNTEIRSGIFSHETSLFQNFQPSSR